LQAATLGGRKVQASGSREDEPLAITVKGYEVAVVEEIVYLGSLIHSTSSPVSNAEIPSLVWL